MFSSLINNLTGAILMLPDFWAQYGDMLVEESWNTLIMVAVSTVFAYLIGLPLGVLLVITQPHGILPNRPVHQVLGWIINIGRSLPFLILMISIMDFTKLIVGTKLGIKGAAIATDIAMAISAVFVMAHFCNTRSNVRFHRRYFTLEWAILVNIVSIGMSPFLVNIASSVINAIINTSLYRYGGDEAIGAFGIFNSYATLVVMLIVGLCQGMQPIVGYNYGAGNYDRMKRAFKITCVMATLCATVGWIGSTFFPYYIIRAFTTDEHLIEVAIHGMRIAMGVFPIVGIQMVATNLFQSLGMASKAIFMSLTRQVIFLIPLLLVLPRLFELNGVWGAMPVSDTIATLVTLLILWQTNRKLEQKNRVTPAA